MEQHEIESLKERKINECNAFLDYATRINQQKHKGMLRPEMFISLAEIWMRTK